MEQLIACMTEDELVETQSLSEFLQSTFKMFVSVFLGAFGGTFIISSIRIGILDNGIIEIVTISLFLSFVIALLGSFIYSTSAVVMTVILRINQSTDNKQTN